MSINWSVHRRPWPTSSILTVPSELESRQPRLLVVQPEPGTAKCRPFPLHGATASRLVTIYANVHMLRALGSPDKELLLSHMSFKSYQKVLVGLYRPIMFLFTKTSSVLHLKFDGWSLAIVSCSTHLFFSYSSNSICMVMFS